MNESRLTRNASYEDVLESLGDKQRDVLNTIENYGPISNEGIANILNVLPHTVTPRTLELRKLNLVDFHSYGISETSNKKVCRWEIKRTEPIQTTIDFT